MEGLKKCQCVCVCGEVDYNYEAINFELKNTCYIISVDYCVTH